MEVAKLAAGILLCLLYAGVESAEHGMSEHKLTPLALIEKSTNLIIS